MFLTVQSCTCSETPYTLAVIYTALLEYRHQLLAYSIPTDCNYGNQRG